jgi:CRP-like cAMP-binding protein
VFRQGDESDKLYIILHGAVSLWVDKEAESRSKAAAAASTSTPSGGGTNGTANANLRRAAPGFKSTGNNDKKVGSSLSLP